MAQFILTVFHGPGVHAEGTAYESEADMHAAFERVNAFNESLQSTGQFVFACGLTPPEQAIQVQPASESTSPAQQAGPVGPGPYVGGFWVIEAEDEGAALAIAHRGATACGQPLEVRALQG